VGVGINSRKPQAAAASASGGAIGDNSSTLEGRVFRLESMLIPNQ
jgi:hypothetical protein